MVGFGLIWNRKGLPGLCLSFLNPRAIFKFLRKVTKISEIKQSYLNITVTASNFINKKHSKKSEVYYLVLK